MWKIDVDRPLVNSIETLKHIFQTAVESVGMIFLGEKS